MKKLIFMVTVIGLISCTNSMAQNPEYNPKAIELNNKAGKLSQIFKEDSALIVYDQAIELDSSYYLPHANKVNIYIKMKAYKKALYESEMVIKKKPDLAEAWYFTGVLNEHLGNSKKAMAYYQKSISIFTDRINNSDDQDYIHANLLNRALSKKFVGDQSYKDDFNELLKIEDYKFYVDLLKDKSRADLMNDLLK